MQLAAVAGLAAYGIGTGLSMMAQYEEGQSAADAGHARREQLEADAKAVRVAGRSATLAKVKEGQALLAKQIAQVSAQGGTLTGSKVEIMAADAEKVGIDANTIAFSYMTESTRLINEGKIANWSGDTARWAARIRTTITGIDAGLKLLTLGRITSGGAGGGNQVTTAGTNAGTGMNAPNAAPSPYMRSLSAGQKQTLATTTRY